MTIEKPPFIDDAIAEFYSCFDENTFQRLNDAIELEGDCADVDNDIDSIAEIYKGAVAPWVLTQILSLAKSFERIAKEAKEK